MLIRNSGESQWRAPAVTAYTDEAAIQALLAQSPDLVPGAEQRLAVAREVALQAGYIDLMGVAPAGSITLVECKLKANPEIRRHVIGQVLAYAATLWELEYDEFDAAFTSRSGASLAYAVQGIAGDAWDEAAFRAQVSANLAAGHFRLVIAVDEITDELRRIVRYLNAHTTPLVEVLALELRYVADSGVEILFPTVYGHEIKTTSTPSGQKKWTEASFFSALTDVATPAGLEAARRLYTFAQERGAVFRWGVGPYPSVTAQFKIAGKPVSALSLYAYESSGAAGTFAVNFEYLVGAVPNDVLHRLVTDLRTVPALASRLEGLETAQYRKRPGIALDALAASSTRQAVETVLDTLIAT